MTSDTQATGLTDVRHAIDGLGSASEEVLAHVRVATAAAAEALAERTPAAQAVSHDAIEQVGTVLRASSSDNLLLGTIFCAGLWAGLLLARAPRLAVLLALIPALVLGGTLASRQMPTGRLARR